MTTLEDLYAQQGQSPWLDNLRRDYLSGGRLQELVDQGIRGVTSNPTIFAKAIEGEDDYDEQFRELLQTHTVTECLLGARHHRHHRRPRGAAAGPRLLGRRRRLRLARGGTGAGPRHGRHGDGGPGPARADRPAQPLREDPGHGRGGAARSGP